jgi:hypothetical protein
MSVSRLIEDQDPYLTKVAKLIPFEVTAVYAAINLYFGNNVANLPWLLIFGLILLTACFFITKSRTNSNLQSALTSLAFMIWAITVSSAIYGDAGARAFFFSILALVSLLMPHLLSYLKSQET